MDDLWQHPALIAALQRRHMGHVIRAYRQHPGHERPLTQETVAEWAGITQAQLSRIETGPPIVHLDRLIHWARILKLPAGRLWFTLPSDGEEDDVRRSDFLKLGVATASAVLAGGSIPWGHDPVEDFAWELWQRGRISMQPSELAPAFAASLRASSFVITEPEGSYALADPSLVDFFVARRIFGGVSRGEQGLFATAQTSHNTDHVLRRFVGQDEHHVATLVRWMTDAADPVLRVNSAGVLGKLSDPGVVINRLRQDADMRGRYVTAVASRVLGLPWEDAAQLAANRPLADRFLPQMAAETLNARDGAARWCSLVLLSGSAQQQAVGDMLRRALHTEPVPENLRAIGGVIAGIDPLEV